MHFNVLLGISGACFFALGVNGDCAQTTFNDCAGESNCYWCWVPGADNSIAGKFDCLSDDTSGTCVDANAFDTVEDRWGWINTNILTKSSSLTLDLPLAIDFCTDPKAKIYGGSSDVDAAAAVFCPFGNPEDFGVADWSVNRCIATGGSPPASCRTSPSEIEAEKECIGRRGTCTDCIPDGDTDCNYLYSSSNFVCTSTKVTPSTQLCCSDVTVEDFDACNENSYCSWCYAASTKTFTCTEPEEYHPKELCLTKNDLDFLKDETDGSKQYIKAYDYTKNLFPEISVWACLQPKALWVSAPDESDLQGKYCPGYPFDACKDVSDPEDNCAVTAAESSTEQNVLNFGSCSECIRTGAGRWITETATCTKLSSLGVTVCTADVDAATTYADCDAASGKWCVKNGVISCVLEDVYGSQFLSCLSEEDQATISADGDDACKAAYKFALNSGLASPIDACLNPKKLLDPSATSTCYYCPLKAEDERCVATNDTTNCIASGDLANEIICEAFSHMGCVNCTVNQDQECNYDVSTGICSTKGTIENGLCGECSTYSDYTTCAEATCAWVYRPGQGFECEDMSAGAPAYHVTEDDYNDVLQNSKSTYEVLVTVGLDTDYTSLSRFCVDSAALIGSKVEPINAFKFLPFEADATKRCVLTTATSDDGLETWAEYVVEAACAGLNCEQCLETPGCYFKEGVCSSVQVEDAETSCPTCETSLACYDCVKNSCCWDDVNSKCLAFGDNTCTADVLEECPTTTTTTGEPATSTTPDTGYGFNSYQINMVVAILSLNVLWVQA